MPADFLLMSLCHLLTFHEQNTDERVDGDTNHSHNQQVHSTYCENLNQKKTLNVCRDYSDYNVILRVFKSADIFTIRPLFCSVHSTQLLKWLLQKEKFHTSFTNNKSEGQNVLLVAKDLMFESLFINENIQIF